MLNTLKRVTLVSALLAPMFAAPATHPTETRTYISRTHITTIAPELYHSTKTTRTYRAIYDKVSSTKSAKINPATFAFSVLATPFPRLLTSISYHENRFNPESKAGNRTKHEGFVSYGGLFHVAPKYHGTVPQDPYGQAQQAARVLAQLKKKHKKMKTYVARYNGAGEKAEQYANNVIAYYNEV